MRQSTEIKSASTKTHGFLLPLFEAVGDTSTVDGLLPDTGNHLGHVDARALGAASSHDPRGVGARQLNQTAFARVLADLAPKYIYRRQMIT